MSKSANERVKDSFTKAVVATHRFVFQASKGRVLGTLGKMPAVMLTTQGRKSGQPRTTMLTAPIAEPDRLVLVASYGGDRRNPQWLLNLRENPEVEATWSGQHRKMRARIADAAEKDQLWPEVVSMYKGYAAYQRRTDRDIPLVILDPA